MRTKPRNLIGRVPSHREARMDKVDAYITIRKLDFMIPVQTISEANQREHWRVKWARKKAQQEEVAIAMHNVLRGRSVQLPCSIKLTRIGPRALDTDNLAGAMKHVQDCIAFKLGADDGDVSKVTWEYRQMPVGIRQYGIKVEINSV